MNCVLLADPTGAHVKMVCSGCETLLISPPKIDICNKGMELAPGTTHSFDPESLYPRCTYLDDGGTVSIYQSTVGDVGCVVWDAAIVLAKFYEHLLKYPSAQVTGDGGDNKVKSVLGRLHNVVLDCHQVEGLSEEPIIELGSGTGYVGIVAASLGAHAIVSDLVDFVPLMDYNIKKNKSLIEERGGKCDAVEITWGSSLHRKAKLVLLADCIYYEQSLLPLVQTLVDLSSPDTIIICCHEERTTDNKPEIQRSFFQEVRKHFNVCRIPTSAQHSMFSSDDIHINVFTPIT